MKTKEEIVANWLPRYTKRNLEDFGEYILLTNFNKYVEIFAEKFNVPILGKDANMISASAEGMTIINFGMGSPNAAIIMDLLSAIQPKACLFLGKCGGIDKKNRIGDLILPIAAIRGEGTSNDYFRRKYRHCRHLCYSVPFLPPFVTMPVIIGQVLYTPPTVAFGNMMKILKNISRKPVPWQLIWRRQPCSAAVLPTIFQPAPCY